MALAGIACIAPGGSQQDNFHVMAARRRWMDGQGARHPAPDAPKRRAKPAPKAACRLSQRVLRRTQLDERLHGRHQRPRPRPVRGVRLLADGETPSAETGYADHAEDRIWEIGGVSNTALAQRHIVEARPGRAGGPERLQLPAPAAPVPASPGAAAGLLDRHVCGTTGMHEVDWLVGDAVVIPPAERRATTRRRSFACRAPIWRSGCSIRCRTLLRRRVCARGR